MRFLSLMAWILVSAISAASARGGNSELQHELYRELHRGQQSRISRPSQPTAEMLACYDRLAKLGHFVKINSQPEPTTCAVDDLVRLESVGLPNQTKVT